MPTLAVFGAGPATGLSLARQYAEQGYDIALVARRQEGLDDLVQALQDQSYKASAYAVDLRDTSAISELVTRISAELGDIETLAFAPSPTFAFTPAQDLTGETVRPFVDLFVYSLIASVQAVLPSMLANRTGNIVLVAGASALGAPAGMSGPAPALAAANSYLQTLRAEVAGAGVNVTAIYVASVISRSAIAEAMRQYQPDALANALDPDVIAEAAWNARGGDTGQVILTAQQPE